MTIANTFAAKLSVAFVAIAMALSMVAPAQAQTAEELQAQIDTLMATIASLQGQLGVSTPVATGNAYVFTRDLTIGATGADVTALQNYLISAGFSIPAGATGYFGSQTQAAVAAWQSANGVSPAAGYFGPVSQAKYTSLVAVTTPTTPTTPDEDEDDDNGVSLSGEASLGDVTSNDGDDTEIEEGQEAAPVAEFEIEFTEGDALITRLDLTFTGTVDPWKTFSEVSLWVDGDEITSKDADAKGDYLSDKKTLRFSGLDILAEEDEPVTVVVAITVQNSVKNLDQSWTVDLTALRYVDADDVTSTEDVSVSAVGFDVVEAGIDDEIIVRSSSEDPIGTTLQVKDNGRSDWLTVFAFDIDTDDSTNDIELDTVDVVVTVSSSTYDAIVNKARLVIDGETFTNPSVTGGNSATATLSFDIDGDLVIDAGDRVTAELELEFKALALGNEGITVQAKVTAGAIDGEGADSEISTGSATGKTHTLRTQGVNVAKAKGSTSVTTVDGANNDQGTYTLVFDVTAFDQEVYISTDVAIATDWEMQDGSGADLTGTGTSTPTWDSSADVDGDYFVVAEGETETFTLEVVYVPGQSQSARLQLLGLNFNEVDSAPNQVWAATPVADYRTQTKAIVN